MRPITALILHSLPLLLALPAAAATDAAAPKAAAAKPVVVAKAATRPAAKPGSSRQQLQNQAKGLALAKETVEAISEAQLGVAARVLTGHADCEFNQRVSVQPVEGKPGHFHVGYKAQRFTMVPEETSTGAVRLQDKRAGVVWLQIPAKSMLMNAKIGQRMVDACQHAEQRLASSSAAAGAGIGIVAQPAAAPASAGQ